MNREEIALALRLVAMGRVNHPQVEQLAEALEGVFARKCEALPVVDVPVSTVELVTIDEKAVGVNVWAGVHGNFVIPNDLYAAIKFTKDGMPDKRWKGNDAFWAWVAEQEAAAQKAD